MYQSLQDAQTWVLGKAGPNTLLKYTLSEARHDALHTASTSTSSTMTTKTDKDLTEGFANEHPHTALLYPVWKHPNDIATYQQQNNTMVAMIFNILAWDTMLQHILPPGVDGIDVVLRNTAGQAFTYRLEGPKALYVGPGDWHDGEYDHLEQVVSFVNDEDHNDNDGTYDKMEYWMSIYPSDDLQQRDAVTPIVMTVGVAVIFIVMIITLMLYDINVVRTNKVILDAAANSNAILAVRRDAFSH